MNKVSFNLLLQRLLFVVTVMLLSACSDTPSDKEVKKLVENYILNVGGDYFVNGLNVGDMLGGYVKNSTTVETVEILKRGEGKDAFPIMIHAKGSYEYKSSGLSGMEFRVQKETRTFNTKREFYIRKNDYGEWIIRRKRY